MEWGGKKYDAIVIGGGHNGLTAAALLGRAHRRVLVLEAGSRLGGAAATVEISPGYHAPGVAHLLEGLPRRLERGLKLSKRGLRYAARNLPTVALDRDGNHLVLPRARKAFAAFAAAAPGDARAYRAWLARLHAHASLIAPLLAEVPPPHDKDAMTRFLRRLVWRTEWRGAAAMREMMRLLPESIGDLLDAEFESPLLKGALAFDATLGGGEGPYAPGTGFRAVLRRAMRMQGQGTHLPAGGMGALIDALAGAVKAERGDIRISAPVARILVEDGAVAGVGMSDGTVIRAPLVVSSLNPRMTMLDLVGAPNIETGPASEISHTAPRGSTAKINLALDGMPEFTGLSPALHGARLLVAPSLRELDEAAMSFRHGEFASEPMMEVLVPSVSDASLAPEGRHILSIIVHYVPHDVEGGWPAHREAFMQRVVRTLDHYAPGIGERMIAGEILTPRDIETRYGLAGGDWHQGDLRLDRLLGFRPAPSYGRYGTPLPGLYLCGAGSHPGGGVTGLPGLLAVETIVRERGAHR
tara:strand:+ start:7270 stop:8847 length:1578 start_codon:yes stop_codon:yes gene_type:complete